MARDSQALTKIEAQMDAKTQSQVNNTAREVIGGIKAISVLTDNLAAQVINALQRFRDEKLYEGLGYDRFDTYLNEDPQAPMSYDQFNRREKLLSNEGETLYNLLEAIKVPQAARKALPPDSFEIANDQLVVADEKGIEFTIPLSDTRRVKQVIANIAREFADKKKKLDDEQKKNEALIKTNQELNEAKAKPSHDLTPYDEALFAALAALKHFADKAALNPEEATAKRQNTLELIGQVWADMNAAHQLPNRDDVATVKPASKRKIPADALAKGMGE